MSWNSKCPNGGPANFDVLSAMNAADFSNPVFVQISAKQKKTKKAYTYYVTGGYRVCLVADVHRKNPKDPKSKWDIAGHCWVPGWDQVGDIDTPAGVVAVVGPLAEQGAYPPGNDRFPQKVN